MGGCRVAGWKRRLLSGRCHLAERLECQRGVFDVGPAAG